MRRIQNISDDPIQRHTIVFAESEIILTLRYYPTVRIWCFDAEYLDFEVHGLKLSAGVLHMRSRNQPFDFICRDLSGNGIDPFQLNDFTSGRCELYLLEPADMEQIRGDAVPL